MVLNAGINDHSMIRQMKKDLGLALQLSHSLELSMNACELASNELPELMRSGLFRSSVSD